MGAKVDTVMDREQRLLLFLLAFDPAASPFADEFRGGTSGVDWRRFEQLVYRHRVAALIHAGACKAGGIEMPDALMGQLAEAVQSNAHVYMRAVAETSVIAAKLRDAGIDFVLLKGLGVAAKYYPEPAQREMIDVDLLVEGERFEEAEAIVTRRGFRRYYPGFEISDRVRRSFKSIHNAFSFARGEDGLQIDLHWRMVQNPALLPWLESEWPSLTRWDSSAGRDLPMLKAAPHFVYIMVHGAKSGWARLKWLADIDRVVRGLSAEEASEVARVARHENLEPLVAASLGLSQQLLGTPLPPEFQQIAETQDVSRLHRLEMPMIFGPERSRRHRLGDWRHFAARIRHSMLLHKGGGYRRKALMLEIARPLDLEVLPLPPQALWTLPVISPVLGIGRALARIFARQ